MKRFFASTLLLLSTVAPRVVSQSIIDLAAADGKYNSLLQAVNNTDGVVDAIAFGFTVTIFAPTDEAFSIEENTLANILTGHVVQGVVTIKDIIEKGCMELTTLSGEDLRVMVNDGSVMVNDSRITEPRIMGKGGIMHGIDAVILPGTFSPCPKQKVLFLRRKKKRGEGAPAPPPMQQD